MKVFRGFTLGLWTLILIICLLVCTLFVTLHQTILDRNQAKGWLAETNAYDRFRSESLSPEIEQLVAENGNSVPLINSNMITEVVQQSIPAGTVRLYSNVILDTVYDWLDSKRPDVAFSIPVSDLEASFNTNLRAYVGKAIGNLPPCMWPYSEDDLANGTCLPPNLSVKDATDAVMNQVTSASLVPNDTLTQEDIALPSAVSGSSHIPDYINYFLTATLFAAGLGSLLVLFLLGVRRAAGTMAIGSAGLLSGASVLLGTVVFNTSLARLLTDQSGVAKDVGDTALKAIIEKAQFYGFILIGAGALLFVLGVLWMKLRKRRAKKA